MLWHKGWLETRIRLLMSLGYAGGCLLLAFLNRTTAPPPGAQLSATFGIIAAIFILVFSPFLAGAGIATQSAFQVTKGLHGSTLFTLSLPVSRLRLLAVRGGLGWLQFACVIGVFCCGGWLVTPAAKWGSSVSAPDMFQFTIALVVCASPVYFLSALLATFLDEQMRMFGTIIACLGLWLLSTNAPVPASVNIFRAVMGTGSPLVAHTVPWSAMAVSVGLAAGLFLAALKIARAREY
jgi:hypothetical protein